MAQFQIPNKDKQWIQVNKGEQYGNLFATWNLDFDSSLGKARVARRTLIRTDDTDDANLGLPTSFVRTSADGTDRWWAACGTVLFKNTAGASPSASNFVINTGTPSTLTIASSDMVEFNSALIVSDSTNLNRLSTTWDGSWWVTTLAQSALTSGIAHPLHVSIKTNLLLIGDGNLLHTVDKNNNVKNSRVILPAEFEITWIRSTYDGTWIGARNTLQREAQAFFWDETADNYNRGYGLKDDMTFAGVIKNGVPYTINSLGQLLKFTGVGFEEAAVFPVFGQSNKKWDDGNTPRRCVHRNGMAVIEGKIHINVASYLTTTLARMMENFPSGIWVYDEKQGLRHKYGLSLYRVATGSEIDYGGFLVPATGALVPTENTQGLFLAGATVGSTGTATTSAILFRDITTEANNRGHFISSIFEASAFEDVFQDILLTFKRFKSSTDRIYVKYRTIKNVNYPVTGQGTYTSTSVFTTTNDLSNVVAGDEVMILRGKGAGATAKISTITVNAGTYTVTLSEAITNASGVMLFRIDDWTEMAIISTQGIERQGFDLDVQGTFVQLKVELRSIHTGATLTGEPESPELAKIVVNSKPEILS